MPEVAARDDFIREEAKKIPAGSWVLDVGAGSSKYRQFFTHCRYETQDFCQYEGPTVKYLEPITYVCDAVAIPLPSNSIDAILCTEVFEHLVDPIPVLKEMARLLKPGGRLLLTAPALSYTHMEPYHFYAGFTRYWHRHWLPLAGLKEVSLLSSGGPARACVIFAQAFLHEWRIKESELSGLRRLRSKLIRAPLHKFATGPLPRVLSGFDHWLGSERVCINHFVVAEKLPSAAGGGQ